MQRAVAFLLLSVGLLVALVVLGPAQLHAHAFRAAMTGLFGSFGGGRTLALVPFDDPEGTFDTRLVVGRERLPRPVARLPVSCRRLAWIPAVTALALALATPLAWTRRLALAAGALAVSHVLSSVRLLIAATLGFAAIRLDGVPMLDVGRTGELVLKHLDAALVGSLSAPWLQGLLAWAVAGLPAGAFRALGVLGAPPEGPDRPAPAGRSSG